MNILRQEIRECMSTPVEERDGRVLAMFSFPADFTGFKGHFSTGPILPGVCKIQALMVLSEFLNKTEFVLKKIKEAKFFSPVSVDEEIVFDYSENITDKKEATIKAAISCEGRKIAKIKLYGSFVFKEEETL